MPVCTLLWLCLEKKKKEAAAKQADISSSSHQTAPEGAVRQQLFVYLDLTCNYVCDRLHHVEKTYLAPFASQSSKGASLSPLITVVHCSHAIPNGCARSEPTGSHLRCNCKWLNCIIIVVVVLYIFHMTEEHFYFSPLNGDVLSLWLRKWRAVTKHAQHKQTGVSVIVGCVFLFHIMLFLCFCSQNGSPQTWQYVVQVGERFLLVIQTVCKCPSTIRMHAVFPHLAFISSCDDLIS